MRAEAGVRVGLVGGEDRVPRRRRGFGQRGHQPVLGVVRPVRHLEHHRPVGIVVVRAHHRDDVILEPILSSGQRRDVLAELGALALEVPQRGLRAVEPVGVDRRAARLALQVRGGDLGADRGDGVVDRDQPGAGLGAGRRLPARARDARGSGRRRSGRSWVCLDQVCLSGSGARARAPGRCAAGVRPSASRERRRSRRPARAGRAGWRAWSRRPEPPPAAAPHRRRARAAGSAPCCSRRSRSSAAWGRGGGSALRMSISALPSRARPLEHHRPRRRRSPAHHGDDVSFSRSSSGQRAMCSRSSARSRSRCAARSCAVEPVGVDRRAARLALQVRGGDLGADRGDGVVDLDQPGARLGAGAAAGAGAGRAREGSTSFRSIMVLLDQVRSWGEGARARGPGGARCRDRISASRGRRRSRAGRRRGARGLRRRASRRRARRAASGRRRRARAAGSGPCCSRRSRSSAA